MKDEEFIAFSGYRRIASGDLRTVLSGVKALSPPNGEGVLVFSLATGRQTDFDLRGSIEEVMARLEPQEAAKGGKGRPRLGVVAGEVTLLPRHWEWLAAQPLRASGTIRRLIDEARTKEAADPKRRTAALGTLLWSLAGNLPDFEEASRALYAGDAGRLAALTAGWPEDVRGLIAQGAKAV